MDFTSSPMAFNVAICLLLVAVAEAGYGFQVAVAGTQAVCA